MRDAWLDLALGASCLGCARAGRPLCVTCAAGLPTGAEDAVAVRPDPCPPGLAPARAAGPYADLLRRLVLAHKDDGQLGLAKPLGALLAVPVEALLTDFSGRTSDEVLVLLVPVPSRPGVIRTRGHDPLGRITRSAARQVRRHPPGPGTTVRVVPLLRQRDQVQDQAGLGAVARAANLDQTMAVRTGLLRGLARRSPPLVAIVCDDVLTTGATAREAQRSLEAVGIPVLGIAVIAATRRRNSSS